MSRASSGSEVKLKLSIWPGLYLLHTPRHIGSVVHGIHEGPAPRSGKRLATTTANELTNMPSRHAGRGDCTRQAVLIEQVERLVERFYEHVQISAETTHALSSMLHARFDEMMSEGAAELADLASRRTQLEDE